MGTFTKVFAHFSSCFWDKHKKFTFQASEKKGFYPVWQVNLDGGGKVSNVLTFYVTGEEGERVECLSKKEVIQEIGNLMNQIYTKSDQIDPKLIPTDVLVTNWSQNPYFKGAYSFFPTKSFEKVPFENMGLSLSSEGDGRSGQKKLFFAGEAFSGDYAGFAHGAL